MLSSLLGAGATAVHAPISLWKQAYNVGAATPFYRGSWGPLNTYLGASTLSPMLYGRNLDEFVQDPSAFYSEANTKNTTNALSNAFTNGPGFLWRNLVKGSIVLGTMPAIGRTIGGVGPSSIGMPLGLRTLWSGTKNPMKAALVGGGVGWAMGGPMGGFFGAAGLSRLLGIKGDGKGGISNLLSMVGVDTSDWGTRFASAIAPQRATANTITTTHQLRETLLYATGKSKKPHTSITQKIGSATGRRFVSSISTPITLTDVDTEYISKLFSSKRAARRAVTKLPTMDEMDTRFGGIDAASRSDVNKFGRALLGRQRIAEAFERAEIRHIAGTGISLSGKIFGGARLGVPGWGFARTVGHMMFGDKMVQRANIRNVNRMVDAAQTAWNEYSTGSNIPRPRVSDALRVSTISAKAKGNLAQLEKNYGSKFTIHRGTASNLNKTITKDTLAVTGLRKVSMGGIYGRALLQSLPGAIIAAQGAISVFGAGKAIANRVLDTARHAVTTARQVGQMEFGTGQTLDTKMASTERSRAIQAMQSVGLSARSYLGHEAALLAQGM